MQCIFYKDILKHYNQTKECLIDTLIESDQESSTVQERQTMDIYIGQYHSEDSSNKSS